jgi:hypothetical protein
MDGAANENERRPFADRILETVKRNFSRDLRFMVGIGDNEIGQVRRLLILKGFEGECCNSEGNSLTNWKPMQVFESRDDVMMTSDRRDDDTDQRILNFPESIKRNCGKIIIQGVTVIQFREERELARIMVS